MKNDYLRPSANQAERDTSISSASRRAAQVLIGVGLPDDAIHAPNEKFDLAQFYGGIETMTFLYDEFARTVAPSPG